MASSKQEVQSTSLPVESQVTTTDYLCLPSKRKKDSMYGSTLMENITDNFGTGMRSNVQCAGGAEEGSNIKDNILSLQEHVKEKSKNINKLDPHLREWSPL